MSKEWVKDWGALVKMVDSSAGSAGTPDLSSPLKNLNKSIPGPGRLLATAAVLTGLAGCDSPLITEVSKLIRGEKEPISTPYIPPTPTKPVSPTEVKKATPEPTIEPTKKPTATTEPSPTIEVVTYPKIEITEEFLTMAFSIGGGEEEVGPNTFATPTPGENGNPKMSIRDLVEVYASAGWGEQLEFQGLTDNPMDVLRVLVSIGTYTGVENGIYTPAGIDGQEVLPLLSGTTFVRVRLSNFLLDNTQQAIEVQEGIFPSGLTLRKDTDMTIIGKAGNYDGTDWVLVSFTDWFRASKEGKAAPRQYFALIPVSLSGDPENKEAFTLENLLAKQGFSYKDGKVSFVDSEGKNSVWELNEVVGEDFQVAVREATGMFFVDKMNGQILADPVVKYPDAKALGLPEFWNGEKRTDEKTGEVYFVITGATTQDGTPVDLAEARYDATAEEWQWKKIVAEVEKPAWLPEVSNAVARFDKTEQVWKYYSTDSQEQDQYIVSVKEGEAGYEYFDFADVLRPILHPELFVASSWEQIKASGYQKALFCDATKVDKIEALSFHDAPPSALMVFFDSYPVDIYYPYVKTGQVSPGTNRMIVYINDINPDIMLPIDFTIMGSEFGDFRVLEVDELKVGMFGILADLGTEIMRIKTGSICFMGRRDYDNEFNLMALDTFARDQSGRIMYHQQS